ncbi:MAG TPA: flavodoxin family protein [Dehalococcoidales bacterium]
MKVVAIIGSPRKNGNTELLAAHALKAIAEEGIETEIVSLAGKDIRGCTACMACARKEDCSIKDDLMPVYNKMKEADGIILASPVYYGSCTALLKGVMERTGFISRFNGERFKGKVGGPLVVARRAGQNFTVAQIDFWFHILDLIEPGSSYWNMAFGREPGEVTKDDEGMKTAWNFGKNIAGLLKKLHPVKD